MEEFATLLEGFRHDATTSKGRMAMMDNSRKLIANLDYTKLKDKQIQCLLEALYARISLEKRSYITSKKTQAADAVRLTQYGTFVRDIVLNGLKSSLVISCKTTKGLVAHMLDILPVARDIIFPPLSLIYTRLLRAIIDHRSCFDHFDRQLWFDCTTFVATTIESFLGLADDSMDLSSDMSDSEYSGDHVVLRPESVALMSCLAALAKWGPATFNVSSRDDTSLLYRLVILCIKFFKIHRRETSAHVSALALSRQLLLFTRIHNSELAKKITRMTTIVCERYWSNTKSMQLKHCLLDCLLQVLSHSDVRLPAFRNNSVLAALKETLFSELMNRPARFDVALMDICFRYDSNRHALPDEAIEHMTTFSVDISVGEKRYTFHCLKALALLTIISGKSNPEIEICTESTPPRKRLKLNSGSACRPIALEHMLSNAGPRATLLALQIQTLAHELEVRSQLLPSSEFGIISSKFSSESSEIQAWALVCAASAVNSTFCFSSRDVQQPQIKESLRPDELWAESLKALKVPSTCRPASHLASVLLRTNIVTQSYLGDSVASISRTIEALGPTFLADSACEFMIQICCTICTLNIMPKFRASTMAVEWFRLRWQSLQSREPVYGYPDSIQKLLLDISDSSSMLDRPSISSAATVPQTVGSIDLDHSGFLALMRTSNLDSANMASSDPSIISAFSEILQKRAITLCDQLRNESRGKVEMLWQSISSIMWFTILTEIHQQRFEAYDSTFCQLCDAVHAILDNDITTGEMSEMLFRSLDASAIRILSMRRTTISSELQKSILNMLQSIARICLEARQSFANTGISEVIFDEESNRSVATTWSTDESGTKYARLSGTVFLCVAICDHLEAVDNQNFSVRTRGISRFETYFLDSSPHAFLHLCRMETFWKLAITQDPEITLFRALDYLSKHVLQCFEYERLQEVHLCVVRILSACVSSWMTRRSATRGILGQRVFEWLVRIALVARLTTSSVRIEVIQLCQEILELDMDHHGKYNNNVDEIPTRDILVKTIKEDNYRVAARAAGAALSIFAKYESHTHRKIYDDIYEVLPKFCHDLSSMQFRILVLRTMATKVEAIRYLAIYHIMEATQFAPVIEYAQTAVQELSSSLRVTAHALFFQGRRYLIWLWLQNNRFDMFPYFLFGMTDMLYFLTACEDELVAQLICQGALDQFAELNMIVGQEERTLILRHLVLIMAYRYIRMHNGQEFDARRFIEQSLGQKMPETTGRQDFIAQLSTLLHDAVDGTRYLAKGLAGHRVQQFNDIAALITTKYRAPSREPLQSSLNILFRAMNLSGAQDSAPIRLDHTTVHKILRSLFSENTYSSSIGQAQCLRKIGLVIAISDGICFKNYLLDVLLRGLTRFLEHNTANFLGPSLCRLTLYVLQQARVVSTRQSLPFLQALLAILKTTNRSHFPPDLAGRIATFLSTAVIYHMSYSEDITVSLECLTASFHNTISDLKLEVLCNEISKISQLLDFAGQHSYDTKKMVIEILSPLVHVHWLRSENFVIVLSKFLRHESHKPSLYEAALISKVRGANFLLTGETLNCDVLRSQKQLIDDSLPILRLIIDTLQDLDLTVVETAEHTLYRLRSYVSHLPSDEKHFSVCLKDWPHTANMTIISDVSEAFLLESMSAAKDFEEWLVSFMKLLLKYLSPDSFYDELISLATTSHKFSNACVVYLVQEALTKSENNGDQFRKILSDQVQNVFENYATACRQQVICCTSILHRLRTVRSVNVSGTVSGFRLLTINYLSAARASVHHRLYEDAALCLEIYCVSNNKDEHSRLFKAIQADLYKNMNEPDSIYGVETEPSLNDTLARAEYEERAWQTLPAYAAWQASQMRLDITPDPFLKEKVSISLRHLGLDFINTENKLLTQVNEAKYESAWRLEQWDMPFATQATGTQQSLYKALCKLQAVKWSEKESVQSILLRTHTDLLTTTLRLPAVSDCVFASMIELEESVTTPQHQLGDLIHHTWQERTLKWNQPLYFQEFEPLLAARQVFMDIRRKHEIPAQPILKLQLELATTDYKVDVEQDDHQTVLNAAIIATELSKTLHGALSTDVSVGLNTLVASVLWRSTDRVASIRLLQHTMKVIHDAGDCDPLIVASTLIDLGLRVAESKLEKPSEILDKYLLPAVEHATGLESSGAGSLHLKFAIFCSDQLEAMDVNEDVKRLGQLRTEKHRESLELEKLIRLASSNDEKRRLKHQFSKAKSLFDIDDAEYRRFTQYREIYLKQSISGFLKGLAMTDEDDTLLLRCTTLWFANSENKTATSSFASQASKIPSHKYLALFNQILARLSTSDTDFQLVLREIVQRLAVDHPYHTLYAMYAVQHSNRTGDNAAKERAKAVMEITQQISKDSHLVQVINNVRKVCECYVKVALLQIDKRNCPSKKIPFSKLPNYRTFLSEFVNFKLPPLTLEIVPRVHCDYRDVPLIIGYESNFSLAGGLSAPKILKCRTNDGRVCKELVKGGNDDLRQDAVMQEVFAQVDDILRRNRVTLRRKLKIRRYKVLPLATNAGVLEWVRDTVPLQEFLQPLHESVYPENWSYSKCRKAIAEVAKKSSETRLAVYNEVTSFCHPVMRHGFLKMFPDAATWYAAQLAYTRTTAAISIVGYVLGLGDRHLHNIILDKGNGEVIHIDLGIAFEQGRTLTIPELVPFRLTRDLVDGMGVLGIEGVFRRCCEFTLQLMRQKQARIKCILDVLRYDPLHSWTLSPVRKQMIQGRDSEHHSSNKDQSKEPGVDIEAARALLIVERKLAPTLSVSAVVQQLIHQARDPENLAVIFAGWAAWY